MLVKNLADIGLIRDSVEVAMMFSVMIGGIVLTYLIQRWANLSSGEDRRRIERAFESDTGDRPCRFVVPVDRPE
jgi:hypothetical protein